MSHEGHDAGWGSGHLEERVLQELLGRGSLRRLPHQHQVQEGSQHRGNLQAQKLKLKYRLFRAKEELDAKANICETDFRCRPKRVKIMSLKHLKPTSQQGKNIH